MEGIAPGARVKREFRIRKEVLDLIEKRKSSGEYETYSDFIEDAVVFYNGVLDSNENRYFLGDEIIKAMKAIVQDSEGRVFSHFRSQDISLSLISVLLAANLAEMTQEEIEVARKRAIEYVDKNFRAKSFVVALKDERRARDEITADS